MMNRTAIQNCGLLDEVVFAAELRRQTPQRFHNAVRLQSAPARSSSSREIVGEGREIQNNNPVKVLELFAGIGGWRLALPDYIQDNAEVTAYDSGPYCRQVYEQNFGHKCLNKNIEQLSLKELEGFGLPECVC